VSHRVVEIHAAPATAMAILIVPLYDTLRVFTLRLIKGKSPFSPDRNHIHHLLIDCGLPHLTATLLLVMFNVSVIIIALLTQNLGNNYLALFLLAIVSAATTILSKIKQRIIAKKETETTKFSTNFSNKKVAKV
jgi:hypothetical protein